ncbi:branched-chain amino acid ABC transporter permease [Corynebacterium phocae]|uniref:Branched-chain amino acid ABC transporter permease n=1 Tax=Corynebacterium phocae TaxID=161895 RepID=A0A1L7D5X8_9CORY|nr:AzlD domain-containing protein [Corynebacterium phocae]APT93544.1 branched-chain amino acid ABC transporter permease [Corynebacterium phocae]KAA8720630.1 branched-chain amino acid ABC transporter permease [Corynebacterium phocae]
MPDAVTLGQVASVLIPVAVVTLALRALPFSFIGLFKNNQFIALLGMTMPVGVMTVLVAYALSGQLHSFTDLAAVVLGVAATVAIHLWKRDATVSIICGTVVYMVLVNAIF